MSENKPSMVVHIMIKYAITYKSTFSIYLYKECYEI